ncbi:hypothetical protein J1605_013882 [Eschrichtius robustus]|uniref:Uncharacterized protein n=1 Tax=Eschrichtius robustus TaxID=9764 RepID=A0AB34GDX2_ESCRO|nr:hypothetical protein J1605_013882 [Eschrichtius robustus]
MMKDGPVWSRGGTLDSLGTVNARQRLDDLGLRAVSSRGGMCSELSFRELKTAVLQRHLTCTISSHPPYYPEIVSEDEIEI